MKHQSVLPNILTASSLCCGLFVIFKLSRIDAAAVSMEQIQGCVFILLLAAMLDVLDGTLARAMKISSEFGGFFDSMADAVSFAVAPSVVVLKAVSFVPGSFPVVLMTAGAMTYSVAGVFRLVRFSTTPVSSDAETKGMFTGLPVTGASLALVSPTLFFMSDMGRFFSLQDRVPMVVVCSVFFLLGYLMVSRWRFPSVKELNIRVSSVQLLIAVAFISSIGLFILFQSFPVVLCVGIWGYVLGSWLLACVRLARGKRHLAIDDGEEL